MADALTLDDILAAQDLEIVEVQVPEWNGVVRLRVLPAGEGIALNERMKTLAKQEDALFALLAACICDPSGRKLFDSPEKEERLKTRSTKVLLRLQQRALELQGWKPEASPAKNG